MCTWNYYLFLSLIWIWYKLSQAKRGVKTSWQAYVDTLCGDCDYSYCWPLIYARYIKGTRAYIIQAHLCHPPLKMPWPSIYNYTGVKTLNWWMYCMMKYFIKYNNCLRSQQINHIGNERWKQELSTSCSPSDKEQVIQNTRSTEKGKPNLWI